MPEESKKRYSDMVESGDVDALMALDEKELARLDTAVVIIGNWLSFKMSLLSQGHEAAGFQTMGRLADTLDRLAGGR